MNLSRPFAEAIGIVKCGEPGGHAAGWPIDTSDDRVEVSSEVLNKRVNEARSVDEPAAQLTESKVAGKDRWTGARLLDLRRRRRHSERPTYDVVS